MAKNLVIVESPAKAKTIEGFLGKDYLVKSSYGHIRDLPGKKLSVDIEHDFQPEYEIPADKKKVVTELKKLSKEAQKVWLASDEDREGEAISWHLVEALKLQAGKTKRIVFHEITKDAINNAIENPRKINKDLVDAQQARRVLDRLVGYELSPVLWRKVKPSLSAGRVQSVAVRLIVEREREIVDFKPNSSFRVIANFLVDGDVIMKAELPKRFKKEEEAQSFIGKCKDAAFTIDKIETKPSKKSPAAPFTTSTLQQEASRKLGYSVSRTMSLAQRLYESGKITYMRTDSVNLSSLAVGTAKKEIAKIYGEEYSQPRKFSTKSKGAQEAHEAIRPTYINNHSAGADNSQQRLYELIWKRTIASQMSDARLEKTTAHINVSTADEHFVAKGEVVKFEGFLKVYLEGKDEDQAEERHGVLPPLKEGQGLRMKNITATERFTHHPPRYTEASLVRKLEELGIGRPSTYAPTISTVQKRGYVVKEDRPGKERKYKVIRLQEGNIENTVDTEITGAEKGKLFPTDTGMVVTDFLVDHFGKILDYSFTAQVEEQFDKIAQGALQWNKMIAKFYKPFHSNVEKTLETAEKATGKRVLGEHPETGKPVIARIGRYGAMVQIGEASDEEKPKFASLRPNQSIESITLEEALDLFSLPREIGEYKGEKVSANVGRYGPYVRWGNMFVSLKYADTDADVMNIELDEAIKVIKDKEKAEKEKYIKTFDENKDVQVLKGRYGPYIKIGRKNYRIPKDKEPSELSLKDCLKIAEEAPKKKKGGRKKRKKKK